MLSEGKMRVSTYNVTWRYEGNHGHSYYQKSFEAMSAQQAVNFARQHNAPEGSKIVEVAKVVNNWK